jgi:hypothetical protein
VKCFNAKVIDTSDGGQILKASAHLLSRAVVESTPSVGISVCLPAPPAAVFLADCTPDTPVEEAADTSGCLQQNLEGSR